MKKNILSIFLVLVMLTSAVSAASIAGFDLSVNVGANQSLYEMDMEGFPDFNGQVGIAVGVEGSREISEKLKLNVGLGYSTLNSETDSVYGRVFDETTQQETEGDVILEFSIAYIDIPVTAEYSLTDKISLTGGLNVSFKSSDTITAKVEDVEIETTDNDLSSTNLSLLLGANFQVSESFGLGLSYQNGLSNILDQEETDSELKVSAINLVVNYAF